MNNIVSREIAAGRYRHLTGWKTLRVLSLPQALAFFQDLWSTYSMNRAINPAATKQSSVCCIDDSVNVLFCDVADNHADATINKSRM